MRDEEPSEVTGGGRGMDWVGLEKRAARWVAWEAWGERARRFLAGGGRVDIVVVGLVLFLVVRWVCEDFLCYFGGC